VPAFAPAVWVATSGGLLKLDAATGEIGLEIGEAAGVRALAVDVPGSVVWAYGRITEKTETVGGVTTVTGYGYDTAGRLEVVTEDGVETARYTYDANGNRLSATTPTGTETGHYGAQDQGSPTAGRRIRTRPTGSSRPRPTPRARLCTPTTCSATSRRSFCLMAG
jgi:YD repeat-containing protein